MTSIYQRALGADFRPAPSADSAAIRLLELRRDRVDRAWSDGRDLEGSLLHGAIPSRRQLAAHHVPRNRSKHALSRSRTTRSSIDLAVRTCRGSGRSNRVECAGSMRTWSTAMLDTGSSTTSDRTSTWPSTSTLSVDEAGGLRLRSGAQRFYEGAIGFSFPMLFSGDRRRAGMVRRRGAMLPNRRGRAQRRVGTVVRLPRQLHGRMAEGAGR